MPTRNQIEQVVLLCSAVSTVGLMGVLVHLRTSTGPDGEPLRANIDLRSMSIMDTIFGRKSEAMEGVNDAKPSSKPGSA
eukprot:CAMPEP_0172513182 /NCGR_PEP_ID=MMETSP1066-20121228/250407_1 /TAXON_ID=671091 /ORGANISM="Coscinodiscus wailesii, Strain CCMP2513" /LENGTH=78 /DNA_ID=CAMNT_0013293333 /DNA_START=198 /DNA_END=434 /DNA_ORIENTATION=-